MSIQELINWGELSRMLTGDRMNIRKNRIPKKHEADVNSLIKYMEKWESELNDKTEEQE